MIYILIIIFQYVSRKVVWLSYLRFGKEIYTYIYWDIPLVSSVGRGVPVDIMRDSWQAQEKVPKVSSRPPFPYFHSHPYRLGDQLLPKATKRVCADKPERNYEWTFNSNDYHYV